MLSKFVARVRICRLSRFTQLSFYYQSEPETLSSLCGFLSSILISYLVIILESPFEIFFILVLSFMIMFPCLFHEKTEEKVCEKRNFSFAFYYSSFSFLTILILVSGLNEIGKIKKICLLFPLFSGHFSFATKRHL